ncbi:MAG: hypothetical protein WC832_06915, partial [Anaerolineales bacterium]
YRPRYTLHFELGCCLGAYPGSHAIDLDKLEHLFYNNCAARVFVGNPSLLFFRTLTSEYSEGGRHQASFRRTVPVFFRGK